MHIAVLDDDARLRLLLRRCFEPEGYGVREAETGPALFEILEQWPVDAIVAARMVAGADGLDLTRRIRAVSDVPIIMTSETDDPVDRVVCLEVGADDCIVKPVYPREVLARIRCILRRRPQAEAEATPQETAGIYRFGGWCLHAAERELRSEDGAVCPLTSSEFDLLAIFVARPSRVLSRAQLLGLLKGEDWVANDRIIDGRIARLRRKMETGPENGTAFIKTMRGSGYVFSAAVRRG